MKLGRYMNNAVKAFGLPFVIQALMTINWYLTTTFSGMDVVANSAAGLEGALAFVVNSMT